MSDSSSDGRYVYAILKKKKIIVILSVILLAISITYLTTTIFGVPRK
jgi:hypothetical protein